ncbi:MAG: hypothetical protein AVDCRST_MAG76-3144, partial [uncultured Acidimicrobiales bacterium]
AAVRRAGGVLPVRRARADPGGPVAHLRPGLAAARAVPGRRDPRQRRRSGQRPREPAGAGLGRCRRLRGRVPDHGGRTGVRLPCRRDLRGRGGEHRDDRCHRGGPGRPGGRRGRAAGPAGPAERAVGHRLHRRAAHPVGHARPRAGVEGGVRGGGRPPVRLRRPPGHPAGAATPSRPGRGGGGAAVGGAAGCGRRPPRLGARTGAPPAEPLRRAVPGLRHRLSRSAPRSLRSGGHPAGGRGDARRHRGGGGRRMGRPEAPRPGPAGRRRRRGHRGPPRRGGALGRRAGRRGGDGRRRPVPGVGGPTGPHPDAASGPGRRHRVPGGPDQPARGRSPVGRRPPGRPGRPAGGDDRLRRVGRRPGRGGGRRRPANRPPGRGLGM